MEEFEIECSFTATLYVSADYLEKAKEKALEEFINKISDGSYEDESIEQCSEAY